MSLQEKPYQQLAALKDIEIDRVFLSRAELTAPWAIDLPAMPNILMFHLVVEGEAYVRFAHQPKKTYAVKKGTLALIPHGRGHHFFDGSCKTITPLFDIPREEITDQYELLHFGGRPGKTPSATDKKSLTLCGAVNLSHPLSQLFLKSLPDVVLVDHWQETQKKWVDSTLELLFAEAKTPQFASKEIIMHLSEVLVFQAIRNWFNEDAKAKPLMKAMKDERITRVIEKIQAHPNRRWSTQDMADEAGMSRSAFTERFTKLFDASPSSFVKNIKMELAEKYFRHRKLSIGEVSYRLGYDSEAAFARAYKRVKGVSPGQIKGKTS